MGYTCLHCFRTSQHPKDEEQRYCGACHLSETDIQMFRAIAQVRSRFRVAGVQDGVLFLVDELDDGRFMSVTNDAERVVHFANLAHPQHRVRYRDTQGVWDELVHEDGVFQGFRANFDPIPAPIRARARVEH